jgi:hypothetical protein
METRLWSYILAARKSVVGVFHPIEELTMPRSLLLSLVAAFAVAACSKQADTGAAPAPETEATDAAVTADSTAIPADTAAPADATVPAEEPAAEPAPEAAPAEEAPAEAAPADEAVPAEEPAMDAPADTVPADSTTLPADSAAAQ